MITDEEIQVIFDWADENGIFGKQWRGVEWGINPSYLTIDSIQRGIPRDKDTLLKITNLNLSKSNLSKFSDIPSEIYKLINLKYLEISGSSFMTLSKDIYNLKNLEYLRLIYGDIKELPKGIDKLKNLKYLELFALENLKELPPEIGNLKKLKYLGLKALNITELPKEISKLIQLKTLDLEWTNITNLPNELSHLINLEIINKPTVKKEIKTPLNLTEGLTLFEKFKEVNGMKRVEILKKLKKISLSFKEKRELQTEIRVLLDILHPSKNTSHLIFSNQKIGNLTFPHKNILLKGVPGTGKSRAIENIIKNQLELENHKENVLRINIHSASSNADLMQGIGISSSNGKIEYKEKQGLILDIIQQATFKPKQPFVLILEEIQENSLNELIGDLIYLIEDDKRAKNIVADDEEYEYQILVEKIIADDPTTSYVEIPYLVNDSTEYRKMIMPNNLYIFCTSNYRDDKKVIEDNLLRRFEVLEVYPKKSVAHEYCRAFFKGLNDNILSVLKDEIHPDRFLIGHAIWKDVSDTEKFYRAFLKVVVEFKDIKEIEFDEFKKIVENINLPDEVEVLNLENYMKLIQDLQTNAGYDFLD